MSGEWFVLRDDDEARSLFPKTISIRPWKPGDGLTCAHINMAKSVRCTSPVAVIRRTERDARPYSRRRDDSVRVRNVCSAHLASLIRSETGEGEPAATSTEIVKAAQEQVIAAHWDEYQAAIESLRNKARDGAYAALPESLRLALEGIAS